ncbi:hypothetical protein [Streptomyces tropicalis]|uniref:Peptidase inhibitor family I36 n=1 Tax=Streptomyces tropicalis TaxID=3034234 RepID=A0ABT6A9D1_9ACTN|nr:hypothetical protein [Streptomyces tropicalis]MDF3301027.1 hypothetical protein [Streptomyces tropicalis]
MSHSAGATGYRGGLRAAAATAAAGALLALVPAAAAQADPGPAAASRPCASGWMCMWDQPHYTHRKYWDQMRPIGTREKCGNEGWWPRWSDDLQRSAWNRTSKTWYGLDRRNRAKVTVKKGAKVPSIGVYKSVTHWCWK